MKKIKLSKENIYFSKNALALKNTCGLDFRRPLIAET